MRSEFIEIDQTLHGYDNGHRLLASSLRLESRDERALLSMSDLSGPRVAENFLEYLTGYLLPSGSHYALAKTWYATEMERPGCVWTHSVLIPSNDIGQFRSLESLCKRFFRPRLHSGYRYTDRIQVAAREYEELKLGDMEVLHRAGVLSAIEDLYNSDEDPVAVIAESGIEFEELALRLWAQLWPALRSELSFCTGSLSRRVLLGKPLVFQCGPDRVIRDIKTGSEEQRQPSSWVRSIVSDLERETSLRSFLLTNADGVNRRSAVSRICRVYVLLERHQIVEAIRLVASEKYADEAVLRGNVLDEAFKTLGPAEFLGLAVEPEVMKALKPPPRLLRTAVTASLQSSNLQTVEMLSKAIGSLTRQNRKIIISSFASELDVDLLIGIADTHVELFNALLEEKIDLCYDLALWKSQLPLLDKIALFDSARVRPDVDRNRLFGAVLDSRDADLSSELISHLTEADLPMILKCLEKSDRTLSLRPQWLGFLKHFPRQVASWADKYPPSEQVVLILANALDLYPTSSIHLSDQSILALAEKGLPMMGARHEVAAFIYVATTSIRSADAAFYCVNAFTVLHEAIAESRLSNRAWHLLEYNLMPLPEEQWDACEKLRRAILYFILENQWPVEALWRVVSERTNLFYDFVRTAKVYDQGRKFFALVRNAGVRGELRLTKQQFKEIKKLP